VGCSVIFGPFLTDNSAILPRKAFWRRFLRMKKAKVGSGEPPISGKNSFTRRQKFDFILKLSFSLLDGKI
jgi:hypothetical protein